MDEGRLLEEILPAFAKSADYTHTLIFVRVCLFSPSIDIFFLVLWRFKELPVTAQNADVCAVNEGFELIKSIKAWMSSSKALPFSSAFLIDFVSRLWLPPF